MKKYRRVHRVKKKKSFLKKIYFWFSSLIFFSFGMIFYFFFFSNFFQVNQILIFGQEKVSESEILSFLNNFLEKKFLSLSTKNILLINLDQIKKEILKNFSQIENIEIKRNFPAGLILKIKEKEAVANFCQEEKCFLIDERGIIFAEEEKSDLLKIFNSFFIENLNLGEKVIDENILEKILEGNNKLKEIGILVEKVVLISEQKVVFKTQEEWEIFVDPQKDIHWQIRKLNIVLKEIISSEKRKNLEYIDLRFGNFAYPKYRK